MTTAVAVERTWQHTGYEGGIEDSLLQVDGRTIGGAYWCGSDTVRDGERWASWGVAGLSMGHPTRKAAEQVQADRYATDPDRYNQQIDEDAAESAAEEAAHRARYDAAIEKADEQDRFRRCGADEPGPTVWTLPAFHVFYAPQAELDAVGDWLDANGIESSGCHPVRVEQRAARKVAVFEKPTALASLVMAMGQTSSARARVDAVETWVVTLATDPPVITTPDRPDLHDLFLEHWPAQFPLIDYGFRTACGACTKRARATTVDKMVTWPCPEVAAHITATPEGKS